MTIRAGMQNLVDRLANEYVSVDPSTDDYFTEEILQATLDKNVIEYVEVSLYATPTRLPNQAVIYRNYYLPEFLGTDFELPQDNAVNEAFFLVDYLYNPIYFGEADVEAVFDPILNRIIFNQSTSQTVYYLTVRSYDLNGSAADIWATKINQRVALIDVKMDNQSLAMDQEYQHARERYSYYVTRSRKNKNARFVRTDQGVGYGANSKYPVIRGFGPI